MSNDDNNRWLICHSLAEGRSGQADRWKAALVASTKAAGRTDTYTTGKDDFERCKPSMGKRIWKDWPCTRATDTLFGKDRFTRALVPMESRSATIGKGTWDILVGFLQHGKPVYAWFYLDGKFVEVTDMARHEEDFEDRRDEFRRYGKLVYGGEA